MVDEPPEGTDQPKNTPAQVDPGPGQENDGLTQILNVDEMHLHPSELDALRRLGNDNPELAKAVVKQRGEIDARGHGSLRFAIVCALLLVFGVIGLVAAIFWQFGAIPSILAVFTLLVSGLVIRVLVTGEWSETSWVGKFIDLLIHWTGGKRKGSEKDDEA